MDMMWLPGTRLVVVVIGFAGPGVAAAQAVAPLPATARKPVAEQYHAVTVVDDYRWLENWDAAAVRAWSDSQNAHTRAVLGALPARGAIAQRVRELLSTAGASYWGPERHGGLLFALKFQPPKQQPLLVTLPSADDPGGERVVFDANAFDSTGGTTIDFYVPSPDGQRVAVSLSQIGRAS